MEISRRETTLLHEAENGEGWMVRYSLVFCQFHVFTLQAKRSALEQMLGAPLDHLAKLLAGIAVTKLPRYAQH
jgi:hypothetical protein